MADIQTQLPIKITDGVNTAAISGALALKVDPSAVTQPVSGTVTAVQSGTYVVSGTITNVPSGTQPVSGTITNVPSGTQLVSGTVATNADAAVAPGAAPTKVLIGGMVYNTAAPAPTNGQALAFQSDASGNLKIAGTLTNVPSGTQPVSGTVTANAGTGTVTTAPTGTQAVSFGSGTFTTQDAADGPVSPGAAAAKSILGGLVYNTAAPAPTNGQQLAQQSDASGNLKVNIAASSGTMNVTGTVTLNTPTVTAVQSGTYGVSVTNAPTVTLSSQTVTLSSQTVTLSSQTVTAVQSGTYTVAQAANSSVTVVPETTQIVTSYSTSATLAAASTATLTYTVTSGKSLYWKGIMASSSGGPCKVIADYGAGPTVVCVAFYSTASPFLNIEFPQPLVIAATTVVNIKIQNNAGASQDVYGTFFGAEH